MGRPRPRRPRGHPTARAGPRSGPHEPLAWPGHERAPAHVRVETSKARRAALQTVDPVLLPSWAEFATIVETPEDEHDRLLLARAGDLAGPSADHDRPGVGPQNEKGSGSRLVTPLPAGEQLLAAGASEAWRDRHRSGAQTLVAATRGPCRPTAGRSAHAHAGGAPAVPAIDLLTRQHTRHRGARQHELPPRRLGPGQGCRRPRWRRLAAPARPSAQPDEGQRPPSVRGMGPAG